MWYNTDIAKVAFLKPFIKMKKTKENFEQELKEKNPKVTLVGNYVDMSSLTHFKCEFGHDWWTTPNSVLKGHGCRKCYIDKSRKSIQQVIEMLKEKHPTFKLIGPYKNMSTKTEFECDKGHTWWAVPHGVIVKGYGCPHCREMKWKSVLDKVRDRFDVLSEYIDLVTPVILRCKKDGHEFSILPRSITRSNQAQCPICGNGKKSITVKGVNDLWTTHPHIAELLVSPEDGYTCSARNDVKLKFKCPDCGKVELRLLSYVSQTMPYCKFCGEKRSYPERFFSAVLNQLGIEYQTEVTFPWCAFEIEDKQRRGRFDFIFERNGKKYIVETDGEQHYEETSFCRNRDVKSIDEKKQQLAEENGYIVIRIDCRESTQEYIQNSIKNSLLKDILPLELLDWCDSHKKTLTSPMIQAAQMWNEGIKSTEEIAKRLGNGNMRGTVRGWLKKCAVQGLCDYTPDEAKKLNVPQAGKTARKSVICLNSGLIFPSVQKAGQHYGVNAGHIALVCKGVRNYAGKHPESGIPLIWMYSEDVSVEMGTAETPPETLKHLLDEKMKKVEQSVQNNRESVTQSWALRNKEKDPIVCLNDGTEYITAQQAGKHYGISGSHILLCCKGERHYAGKQPKTKQPLIWRYKSSTTDKDLEQLFQEELAKIR